MSAVGAVTSHGRVTDDAERVVAAIDVGTNMVRLRVERVSAEWHSLVAHDWAITRLGGGQQPGGPLDARAVERTMVVLERFADRARALGASAVWVAATSAVREASNRHDFVNRARVRAGLAVDVIGGAEEARLDALGAVADLGGDVGDALLVDIGGGSTELVRIEAGRVVRGVSFPVGVVRLTERFVRGDPPSRRELDDLEAASRAALASARDLVPRSAALTAELIANSGTAATLAAVDLGLAELDPDRLRAHLVQRESVEQIYRRLASITAARRLEVPGVVAGREDLIVAGLALLREVMDLVGATRVRVSTGGLLEGLLVDRARGPVAED